CSLRECEIVYCQFLFRLALAEDLAWDSDNLPALEVFRDLAEVQDYSCSSGFTQEAGDRDPERSLVLFSRLHEVAYGADQFRVCWPTLLHFSGSSWRSDVVPRRLPIKPFECDGPILLSGSSRGLFGPWDLSYLRTRLLSRCLSVPA